MPSGTINLHITLNARCKYIIGKPYTVNGIRLSSQSTVMGDYRCTSVTSLGRLIFTSPCLAHLIANSTLMTPSFVLPPVVRLSTFSSISSESNGPIELKFQMETPKDKETKVCSNGPGHMAKMTVVPIYGI